MEVGKIVFRDFNTVNDTQYREYTSIKLLQYDSVHVVLFMHHFRFHTSIINYFLSCHVTIEIIVDTITVEALY